MFDLMVRQGATLDAVPVPLPGRVILFAGPGGVPMVRDSAGKVSAFQGAPGLGASKVWRGQTAALRAVANERQVLFSTQLAQGDLSEGAVLSAVAVFSMLPVGATSQVSATPCARVNGGNWVDGAGAMNSANGVIAVRLNLFFSGGMLAGVVGLGSGDAVFKVPLSGGVGVVDWGLRLSGVILQTGFEGLGYMAQVS